jgi:hypothetical protein
LKIEAARSYETMEIIFHSTMGHIAEDLNLHRAQNFKLDMSDIHNAEGVTVT